MAVPSNNGLEQEVSPPAAAEDSVPPTAKVVNREATELEPYHSAATDTSTRTMIQYQGHFEPLKKFWRRQVSLTVPHVKCRDHLGMSTISRLTFHHLDELKLTVALQQMSERS